MSTIKKERKKVYIEGVRRISWDTGEMCEFASALVSAMLCLGEDIPYDYVMGTSGVAFRFTLNPGEWDFGNYSVRNIAADADEPIRCALDATGYAYTLCEKTTWRDDAAHILASIDRGIPVLAYGMVGPSDCCIITGYDQDGEVLLGWSTYQDIPQDHSIPHDATGYFRKPGWYDKLHGYILIGDKKERQPLRAIYLDALKWATHLMQTPTMGDKLTGLEALRAWAEEMTQEKYFPAGDEETLGGRYVSVAINMTMLRDHCSAEAFLKHVIADVPDFEPELSLAAGCYADVKRIRNGMDDLIGDNFSEQAMKAIAVPDTRRAYADAILQIRDVEQKAVTHIEQLIERCG
jgi:hypothetical protein